MPQNILTASLGRNIITVEGNGLAIFVDDTDFVLKLKDVDGNIQAVSDFVGSGGTSGGGAGGVSSYEQALMDALASREKAAKQDKWLSLAQVGLNLMSSRSPTLLGALGEAGLKGVESARTARDQYDKDKLELQGALEKSRMARAAASASAASGASRKAIPEGALDMYDAEIEALSAAASDPMAQPGEQLAAANRLDAILAEKAQFRDAYRAQFGIDPTGASPAATSGVYSRDDVTQ